ncbi:MAG: spermidine/putrescine ABC transporter permease PotB [Hahellaceae bacterium]|nr:spermidine/putrescine ABC transporter permease PotB [Hahellaceae bacterium]
MLRTACVHLRSPLFSRTLIAITLSWLGIFVLTPHLLVMMTSVLTPDTTNFAVWPLTFEAYTRLWEPLYATVFLDSLYLSVTATLFCLLLGYPFAYLLSRLGPVWRNVLLFLMIVPFWTNSLIRTYALKLLMGNRGLFNDLLMGLGLIDSPIQMLYSGFAVTFGLVYILFPFMVLPLISSFDNLDKTLLEAARDLGASAAQRFWRIIVPLTMPGIIAGCLIVFLPAMGMFYVADLLGGARNLLLGNLIKNQFLVMRDWPFGSALSVTLILMMFLMLAVYARANRRIQRKGGLDDANFA